MKNIALLVLSVLFVCVSINAQTGNVAPAAQASADKPKKQIFRATKDQIKEVQTMLKAKSLYTGESTGKLDNVTRAAIKSYQKDNGLKQTGTLNRATLEKMGIVLTESQKAMPVLESSYAASAEPVTKTNTTASVKPVADESKPKRTIFRATKDQITEAQKMLKAKSMYIGDETGKLDDATRDSLKKYQEANGLKATGTLNQVTLEKMGIELTDKQKADSEGNK